MPAETGFVEVASGVFLARYPQWDVGVGLVVGSTGALVIDTRASAVQGRQVLEDLRRLSPALEVTAVVNTHVHFDHTFGNIAFEAATVHAHERVAVTFQDDAERLKALVREDMEDAPEYGYTVADLRDLLDTTPRGPDVTVTESATINLGGRVVQLEHMGRGHTDGDIAIHVPDARVTFLGDLIESSAPPSLGGDSWPLDWPETLARHAARLTDGGVVVPGHGPPVDADFVRRQADELGVVATVIREREAAGIPLADAQREADSRLPYALDRLGDAFARGYAQASGVL
jgi:glyoxylase-like metal-dependent hydrolase (beta-lactamase superfamily II)